MDFEKGTTCVVGLSTTEVFVYESLSLTVIRRSLRRGKVNGCTCGHNRG